MIYGKRIRLRADERADLPKFTEWLNDPQVRRFLSISLPFSLAAEEQWFEDMLKRPAGEQPLGIEIRDGDAWRLVGNCGFFEIDRRVHSSEVGLFIGDKSCWNQGYGTEVMRLLLRHGFQTLNLNRIYLRVDSENLGGIHAYQKAGFIQEALLRQAAYREGKYCDELIMSVLRSEWTPEE
jgi:diamine N-acetyltransferase